MSRRHFISMEEIPLISKLVGAQSLVDELEYTPDWKYRLGCCCCCYCELWLYSSMLLASPMDP